jgi:uncharacterized protein (TIGR00251 family)
MEGPAIQTAAGISLLVWLTPKSGKACVDGVVERAGRTALKVHVTAAPEDGKANAALLAVLSDWLGVAKSSLKIEGGHKSRLKSVLIQGRPDEFLERMTILLKTEGKPANGKRAR